jgi:hypothetical protein
MFTFNDFEHCADFRELINNGLSFTHLFQMTYLFSVKIGFKKFF